MPPSRGVYWRRRTVVGGLLALAGYGAVRGVGALLPSGSSPDGTYVAPVPVQPLIRAENEQPGTLDYSFPFEDEVTSKVAAYCAVDSAWRGQTVPIMASTEGSSITARAFRMGWYGGAGAREVWRGGPFAGVAQVEPDRDPETGVIECAWAPSFEVTIDESWTPGMYLFRIDSDDGGSTYVPLVVLDDRPAELLVISSMTTWQAYNEWGGASLYYGPDGRAESRAKVVSFDRPYEVSGSGHFFGGEFELVQLVESLGYDVAYTTNLDFHARPEQATQGYKAIVSLAHDEYYSLEMRQALEAAREAGVNLMFLGANAIFRRIRLEPSTDGRLGRTMVNYRTADADPWYGTGDDARVTSEWREEPARNPESALVGNFYESNPCEGDMVIGDADSWVFAGTGLRNGDRLEGLVGNEYDRVTPEEPTPANIQVLCHSPLVVRERPTFADMTYYTYGGTGAGVWATGTLWWERKLGPLCDGADGQHTLECHVRRITANVLEVFTKGPAGATHPSVPNLAAFGIAAGYVDDPPPG